MPFFILLMAVLSSSYSVCMYLLSTTLTEARVSIVPPPSEEGGKTHSEVELL
jgi:hypothetical protein